MHYTPIGNYVEAQIQEIAHHYPYADIFEYVIMPNHLHFMIEIFDSRTKPIINGRTLEPSVPTKRTLLGVVIGGFKRSVTMYARKNDILFEWQSRYHDHIIRDYHDFNKLGEYIKNKIGRWEEDCFYK